MLGKSGKKKGIIIVIILIIAVILVFSLQGEKGVTYDTMIAESQDLKQEINATGRIEAVSQSDLAFETSGRVKEVLVSIGDIVEAGDLLLSLESGEASAELLQASASIESARASLLQYEASLLNQKAKLDEMLAGTRVEEISLYESKVASAESSLASSKEGMINAMEDAYARVEDSITNTADQLLNSPNSTNPSLKFTTTNSNLKVAIKTSRILLESILVDWKNNLDSLSSDSNLDPYIVSTKVNLEIAKSFLEDISGALNESLPSSTVSQTQLDTWRASISVARTSVNLGITNYTVAKEKLKNAETALKIAEDELALKRAPSTPEQINAQRAAVDQAVANLESQKADIKLKEATEEAAIVRYEKNLLKSPIAGVVTKQDAKQGEIVAANQILVSVISEGDFEIEAFIVEADIVGLEVGDQAVLTLDAYGDDVVFEAVVMKIDPAAQQIEGVANYRIILELPQDDVRIKAGMTADIDIVTDERTNVIAIPQRAVIFKDNKKTVRVLNGEILNEVDVETGIRGERGLIEIVSGIQDGDIVVTAVNE